MGFYFAVSALLPSSGTKQSGFGVISRGAIPPTLFTFFPVWFSIFTTARSSEPGLSPLVHSSRWSGVDIRDESVHSHRCVQRRQLHRPSNGSHLLPPNPSGPRIVVGRVLSAESMRRRHAVSSPTRRCDLSILVAVLMFSVSILFYANNELHGGVAE